MTKLNPNNTIFYSTANAGYAIYAATSLLRIRKYHPDAKLYILSSGLNGYDREILEKNDIGYHEVDLSRYFYKTWEYPIDCYYVFAGPEKFYEKGYKYSVYIDGDILCASDPLAGLPTIKGIASASQALENITIFGSDWPKIRKIWGKGTRNENVTRINSGVVYFNNKRMMQIKLLDSAASIYKTCIDKGVPRKGDDSLLALLQQVSLRDEDVTYLPIGYNYTLQLNEVEYPIDGLVFLHFTVDKPWKSNPYQHDDNRLVNTNPYIREWRNELRSVSYKTWLRGEGKKGLVMLRVYRFAIGVKRLAKDFIWSLQGFKKSWLTRRINARKKPIALYWWHDHDNGIANFGDEITSDILLRVFGYNSVHANPDEAELVGAGSIIEIASHRTSGKNTHVWGSGYMWSDESRGGNLEGFVFSAVRGLKTKSRIQDPVMAVGDPGLLASIVYKRAKNRGIKVGVVAHFVDADEPLVMQLRADDRFMLIDPLDTPDIVAENISSCRFVLSSSLHGLIFADSFNVPNAHIRFSQNVAGGTYKFEDYYSATGREYFGADASLVMDDEYINTLESSYASVKGLSQIQRGLIRAFPRIR